MSSAASHTELDIIQRGTHCTSSVSVASLIPYLPRKLELRDTHPRYASMESHSLYNFALDGLHTEMHIIQRVTHCISLVWVASFIPYIPRETGLEGHSPNIFEYGEPLSVKNFFSSDFILHPDENWWNRPVTKQFIICYQFSMSLKKDLNFQHTLLTFLQTKLSH